MRRDRGRPEEKRGGMPPKVEILGCGYAAAVDLMDNPEGLPTSSTASKRNGKIKSMIIKQ